MRRDNQIAAALVVGDMLANDYRSKPFSLVIMDGPNCGD